MGLELVHIVDEQTAEDAARLCSLLLHKLPTAEVQQSVVVMGRHPAGLIVPDGIARQQLGRPMLGGRVLSATQLNRKLAELHPNALLAYSGFAAAATAACSQRVSMTAIVADPGEVAETSRWLTGYGGPIDVVCLSGMVQRRLVERGVPLVATAVIRPGVDFGEIRRARESFDRSGMDLPTEGRGRVMVTLSPPSRAGGQYYAVWAVAILHHIWPDAVLVVPGCSREQGRIGRLIDTIYCPQAYRLTEDRYSLAELLSVADAVLVPALADDSMDGAAGGLATGVGGLAWAMGAGVPIIGSAVPSVTEYVTDGQTGFLCRPGEPHTLAIRIRSAFESADKLQSCVQAARHQAYENFCSERCIESFMKLIQNMAARRPALAGIGSAC